MADEYETPISITIPIPTERPRMYGIHSNYSAPGALRLYPRLNPHECRILQQACEILQIKPASFSRDVIVNVAEKIVEGYNDHRKRNGGG
jgi:hypothetical protein